MNLNVIFDEYYTFKSNLSQITLTINHVSVFGNYE